MRIRKATIRDLPIIQRIVKRELYLPIPGFHWHIKRNIAENIRGSQHFVAVKKGDIVGIIGFIFSKECSAIEMLAVVRRARGRGVGQQLVKFARRTARLRGNKLLTVCSFYEYRAEDFYRKAGFQLLSKPGIFNGHKYHRFVTALT